MGIVDVLWVFFIISVLQPMLRQRMLDASRGRLMAQLDGKAA